MSFGREGWTGKETHTKSCSSEDSLLKNLHTTRYNRALGCHQHRWQRLPGLCEELWQTLDLQSGHHNHGIILQRDVTASSLFFLPSLLQDRDCRSRVSMRVGGEGQHLLCPLLWTGCCGSWEGKHQGCFHQWPWLPLGCQVKANPACPKEQPCFWQQRAVSYCSSVSLPMLGLPTSFNPARENLLLCQGADTELKSPMFCGPIFCKGLFSSSELGCTCGAWSRSPSQPYIREEVVEVPGAAQGRKASVAISDRFPET